MKESLRQQDYHKPFRRRRDCIRLLAQTSGVVIFFAWFFYRSIWAVPVLLPLGILYFRRCVNRQCRKNRQELTIQFKECILSVANAQIQEYDGKKTSEGKTVCIENPTASLEEKRNKGLLKLVTEEEHISSRRIETESLLEKRIERGEINRGNLELGIAEQSEGLEVLKQKVFFHEYLLRYLGRYGQEKQDSPLWYQTEYVIIGKDNDTDNLKGIVNRIFVIREAANTMYLTGCEEKRAIAELLGETLAAAMMVPEIGELLAATLILGWAFAESVYDVKELLAGEKMPLIKTDATWHYGLSSALQGELPGTSEEDASDSSGMGYEDYLRLFLLLCEEQAVTCRAMDVVEMDIRNTPGNGAFRLDACIVEIAMNVKVKSKYGYSFEIERQKSYIESLEAMEDTGN